MNAGMYVWNATDGNILELFQKENEEQYISSVKWIKVRVILFVMLACSSYCFNRSESR